MKKNCVKKALAWLLAVLQLLACTSLAETIIDGVSTFSVSEFTGNYTVRFLDMNGDEVYQVTGVEYAAFMDGPFSKLLEAHPEYETALWSVSGDYRVLNNVDVLMRQENAVAQVGEALYATLQEAIDADATVEGSTILLLTDTRENIDTKGKSFTLDMGGHTLTAAQAGVRAYTQMGGTVTVMQGTITGAYTADTWNEPGKGAGMYVKDGSLTARYMTIQGNTSRYEGGGLHGNGSAIVLDNCSITGNTDYYNGGGGVYVKGGSLKAENTVISGNRTVEADGIGIWISCDAELTNCIVTDNHSTNSACSGAVYVEGNVTLKASGLEVSQNTAVSGGTIEIQRNAKAVLGADCSVTDNKSEYGGIYVASNSSLTALDDLVVSGNEGEMCGGLYVEGALELSGAKIENNTATEYGAGGMRVSGTDKTVEYCEFLNNSGPTGALEVATNSKDTAYILDCTFKGNVGTQYAGAIYDNRRNSGAWLYLSGNTITGNTGYKAGGIYELRALYFPPDDNSNIVCDNTSNDGNYGNDITIAMWGSYCVGAANAMGNNDPAFSGYAWVGGRGTATIGTNTVLNPYGGPPAFTNLYYTAKLPPIVAQNSRTSATYYTLKDAIAKANHGDTIVLIGEDNAGNPLPLYESVTVNKRLTLDLNGHELGGANSTAALTITNELTLTGAGRVCGAELMFGDGVSKAVVNQGKLILDTDARIEGIEHKGSLLQADCPINVTKITLASNKVMTGGSGLDFEKLEFVLPDATVKKLNEGWKSTDDVRATLITPMQDATLKAELPGVTAVSGTNGYVTVEIDESGNMIAHSLKLKGVYVGGQDGDDGNSGLMPEEPVKTFKKAKEVLEGLLGDGSALTDEAKAAVAGIYVMGQLSVDDEQPWSLPEGKQLIRFPDYKGYLVEVAGGKTLTLENIVVDGASKESVEANSALVKVLSNGTLNIKGGAALQNNQHTITNSYGYAEAGGAVLCNGGAVNLDGGTITGNTSWYGGGVCMLHGTLTMNSGTITKNSAGEYLSNYPPQGGGVALLLDASMNMNGGTVSYNTSGDIGGGISVGATNSALVSTATLTMKGGTVNNNIASDEGGGIFIQAEATGYVYGGNITHNESHGGEFGGGGIYVNGARTVDKAHYGTGKLYLENVIITDNEAGQEGGGMAGCSTSETRVYVGNGGAIYGNTAATAQQLYVDGGYVGGFRGTPDGSVSPYMLDGTPYNWFFSSGVTADPDVLSNLNATTRLENPHTDETAAGAVAAAKGSELGGVMITDNKAKHRGGGVGSNGFVQIGTEPTEGDWTPEGSKALTGRDMKAGEFTFTVWENGTPVSYGKNIAPTDGETEARIEFAPAISYNGEKIGTEHTYLITEDTANLPVAVTGDATEYTVTVTVVEGYDSEKKTARLTGCVSSIKSSAASDEVSEVAFKNEYKPAKAELTVKKTVTGQSPVKAENFTFELALQAGQANAQYVIMPKPATVTITGTGIATFGSIAFEKAGEYAFTIKEVPGKATGYTYDSGECQVIVKVTDTAGELKAESIRYSKNGKELTAAEFENPYAPVPVSLRIPVSKTVQGDTPDNKTFTFELRAATERAPMPQTSTITITGTGNAEFGAIEYTEPGVWRYTVRELTGVEQYYTYDKQVYTVTVTVTDEGGSLKATWITNRGVVERLAFVNSYATPTPTPAPTPTPGPEFTTIRVTKQWQDMDDYDELRPESVTIHLERRTADGEYETVDTIEMTGEGNTWTYTFQGLPTRNDAGVRYQYRVREEEVEGYAVQYNGYIVTNVHVVVTPTPEITPLPTPTNVGPKPERAVGMKYEDGEWIWIDDMGVPLGVVAITGDDDNLTAVLVGMALFLVGACGLVFTLVRKGKKKKA